MTPEVVTRGQPAAANGPDGRQVVAVVAVVAVTTPWWVLVGMVTASFPQNTETTEAK